MYPIVFRLGPLTIPATICGYGTMVAVAFLVVAYIRKRLAESAVSTLVFGVAVAVLGCLIVFRLLNIFQDWSVFREDPVRFIRGPLTISLTIYSYGTMMAIAFLTATYLTGSELNRKGFPESAASTMVFWAAIGGLLGARLLTVLEDFPAFVQDPIHFIFTGAGFTWYGGLIGGFIAVTWAMRRLTLPFLPTVDCIAPSLALGHAIGRIGCQLAGDGDWGRVSTLPWAMAYPHAIIGWNYPPGVRVHPTPVYETIIYTGVFVLLWTIRKREHIDGALFWWYLVLASTARFLIEFVRINHPVAGGLTLAQWMSIGLVAIGAWRLLAGRATAPRAAAARSAS